MPASLRRGIMEDTIPYQPGMNLGRTYDLQKLKPGLDIFTDEALSRSKTIERHQTSIRYSVIKKSSDINNILDVSGEISLKVKAGLFKVEGMGTFLKDDSWKENDLVILARAHVETMTVTMTDSETKPGWKNNIVGSHYIRSITYGGDLIVWIQIQGSDNRKIEDIKAKLDAGLKTGGIIDAGAKANFIKLEEDLKASSNINISCYSTSMQGKLPRDIDEMLNALDTFKDQVMKLNEGKGVPLMCELQPLNILDPDLPKIMRDKSLDVQLIALEENYDDILQAKAKLKRFTEKEDLDLTADQEKKASELETRLDYMISVFNSVIASVDVTVGGKGKPQIKEAISAYQKNKKIGGFNLEVAKFMRSVQQLSEASGLSVPQRRPLNIVMFGRRGNGKSATGNTLLCDDSKFISEMSPDYPSTDCTMENANIRGRELWVVDTPGSFDPRFPDEARREIAKAIQLRPDGYDAFFIVLRVGSRITREEEEAILRLQRLFGERFMKFTILIFTHGDNFDAEMRRKKLNIPFLQYIKSKENEFCLSLLRQCDDRYVLVNNCSHTPERESVRIMTAVDRLTSQNRGQRYTNRYFQEAQRLGAVPSDRLLLLLLNMMKENGTVN